MGNAHAHLYKQLHINKDMKPIEIICQDVFDKIRSRFENLEMGDETGAVTIDPGKARFFDFDFIIEGNDLGRVSISLNDIGSLKIYYSKGITENKDSIAKQLWYNFLKEMRMFAMRRLLRFDTRDITKTNLEKQDFNYLAKKAKEPEMTQMNESRWNKRSSSKTSRAATGKTQVIVRHSKSVEGMFPGARSQRQNIKRIFIESPMGERFLYPFIHPAGAFAMAQHVDHGGVPHDPAGKAIMRMSEEIAQLQEFSRHVQRSQLHDDAMSITERANQRLIELKNKIAALSKRRYYENWIAEFNENELDDLSELDETTLLDYKNKFTQTNFQEELTKFFPLIHKIMKETSKIDLEEFVNEDEDKYTVYCSQCGGEFKNNEKSGFSSCKDHRGRKNYDLEKNNKVNEFTMFEQWAEAVEQGKLSDDQVGNLKQALADLQVPLDLDTAYNFFNELGIDDEDLNKKFDSAKEYDPEIDPMEVFKKWADENYPELLVALGMSQTEQPTTPSEPPMPAEAPAEAPAQPAAVPTPQPTNENDEMAMLPGVMETKSKSMMIKEVAKIVKQFYNRHHEEQGVGPFPKGKEGVCLEVEKRISEKYGDKAGKFARQVAEQYIQQIEETEELHRMKDMARLDDARGDRGFGQEAFNNIQMGEEMSEELTSLQKRELLKTLKDKWRGGSLEQAIQDTLDSLYAGNFIDRSQRPDSEDFLYSVSDRLFDRDSNDSDISGDEDFMLGLKHDDSRSKFDEHLKTIKKLSGLAK